MPISNKEEMQIIKGWWREYGYYLVFTVVIFLVINFGWRYWHNYKRSQLASSSVIYMQMLSSLGQKKNEEVKLFGERLIKNYTRTPYSSLAALLLAKEAVQKGDLKLAQEKLQFVIKKAPNKKIRELARIRTARILIAMEKPKEALVLLSKVSDKDYTANVSEVFGDALLALDNVKDAKRAYRKAEHLTKDKSLPLPLLKMKLQQF